MSHSAVDRPSLSPLSRLLLASSSPSQPLSPPVLPPGHSRTGEQRGIGEEWADGSDDQAGCTTIFPVRFIGFLSIRLACNE